MTSAKTESVTVRPGWIQMVVLAAGLFYTAIGLTMFLAPVWFFEYIGHFPPFNRHYIGDLAAFILPMGGGLLIAASNPLRYRLLLWVIGVGNLLHSFNHVYDAAFGQMSLAHWLTDTVPLLIGAGLFFLAIWPHHQSAVK